jgi:hypothetical protein
LYLTSRVVARFDYGVGSSDTQRRHDTNDQLERAPRTNDQQHVIVQARKSDPRCKRAGSSLEFAVSDA